jgi:hypothetical protein
MNENLTPYELSILLHYYTCPTDWEEMDAPAWRETILKLTELGLLEEDKTNEACYRHTEKLVAHIEHILCLPLPVQKWVIQGVNKND